VERPEPAWGKLASKPPCAASLEPGAAGDSLEPARAVAAGDDLGAVGERQVAAEARARAVNFAMSPFMT